MKKFLLAFLLFPVMAFATTIEESGQINWGGASVAHCSTQIYQIALKDPTIDVSGTAQLTIGLPSCGDPDPTNFIAAIESPLNRCRSQVGFTTRITDVWYQIYHNATLGTDEQCKIGLSIDFAGGEPYDFVSWTSIDIGEGTSGGMGNCDEQYNPNADGSFDDPSDACHVSDSTGIFLNAAKGDIILDGWHILIDDADSGSGDCTALTSVVVTVKAETCVVPYK